MSDPKLTLEEVQKVARLSRLALRADELDRMRKDLDAILGYVAVLDSLDTSQVTPMAHALSTSVPLRPDVVVPGPERDEVLAAAPAAREGGFSVPKVLEVEG